MYRCYTRPICYITISTEIYVLQTISIICVIKFVVKKIAMCNQNEMYGKNIGHNFCEKIKGLFTIATL